MDAILQKIKADIIKRPLNSLLVILTISASATLLTLAIATLVNISAPYDQSFEDLNAAHLWLHFNRNRIRARDIEMIENLPGVSASTGLRYSVNSRAALGDTRVWVSLRAIPLEPPSVNRLLVREGRYLNPQQSELLASKDLNDLYRLSVGDEVGFSQANGKTVQLPVIGLAYNPMWDTYRNTQAPYIYVSEETLRRLYPDESTWDWALGLRLTDPEAVDEMTSLIESKLRKNAVAQSIDWRDVRESAIFGAQLNFVLLGAFSFFAILATFLVVTSSISSNVLSQFKQIGMLKAIGFTQAQIFLLYVGQYFILSLVGAPLGLLAGIALSPLPLKNVAASLNAAFRPPLDATVIILVLSVIPGIVALATLSAAWRGARTNIVKAIAAGAEAPSRKSSWGAKLAARLNLPIPLTLGLNDVFAKPFRSFITGLNLTLGVMGIIFGLTLNSTIKTYSADPSLLGIAYDALVTRQETGHRRTESLLNSAPGVEAFYSQYIAKAETPAGQSFEIKAVAGELDAFPFALPRGRFFTPNTDEAIAGQGLLDWLNLKVGDELTVLVDDKPITWRIVGQYTEPVNSGQMLMVSLPALAKRVRQAKPTSYYLKLAPNANPAQLKEYLSPKPDSDLNLTLVGEAIPDSIVYLQLGIFALAAILIGIALVNVFNTALQSTQEKLRAIGILKTLGMTPAQVSTMVNTTAGFLGFVAALVGIPLGWGLTRVSLALFSQAYGFGQVAVSLNAVYVILLFPLMVGVSMLGSFIPARQAANLVIVRTLRHE